MQPSPIYVSVLSSSVSFFWGGSCYLFNFYLFIFSQRGKEGEEKGEKDQYVVYSRVPPTGDLA